ncbi:hypothetical protein RRG08_016712 [Elysia crispata]|uniref:Uncharacterized protein n=1 Tax=Elysia crispata TaxID=231223 RepID=A0AAE1DK71_9GAST|nr:hypothetical protein RRG08_016712 [Elysia crispata]
MPNNTNSINADIKFSDEKTKLMTKNTDSINADIKVSDEKTKLMTNTTDSINADIQVRGEKLQTVNSFKHSGCLYDEYRKTFSRDNEYNKLEYCCTTAPEYFQFMGVGGQSDIVQTLVVVKLSRLHLRMTGTLNLSYLSTKMRC